MSGFLPCTGLRVLLQGSSRRLAVAGRLLADLGATVNAPFEASLEPSDRAWLGVTPAAPDTATDLCLIDGPPRDGLFETAATTAVFVVGTGSTAGHGHQPVGERELAGLAGVAVVVGEPGRPPLPVPPGCLDAVVGAHVAGAGLAGLLAGTRRVEVAAVDVIAAAVATNASNFLPYGVPWHRAGRRASASGGCYPYGLFRVADGYVCLIGRSRDDWEALLLAAGEPEWSRRPRYRDLRAMGRDYPDEVDALLAPWLERQSVDGLVAAGAAHGFPVGPVRTPAEVLETPALAGWWRRGRVGGEVVQVPGCPFALRGVAGGGALPELEDLFVLDLSWVWSGPAVGAALADLGATVVKVESRRRLDNTRLRGRPSFLRDVAEAPALEVAPLFHALNRGKHSLALDLTSASARDVLLRLAESAHVIVENLRPGVCDRFGLDPATMAEINPGCVYLSMPGYPAHPDFAGLRAYAPVLSGAAGIESVVRYPGEDVLGLSTFGFSDANAAAQGILAVLAGLWGRRRAGVGSRVVLNQFSGAVFANGRNLVDAQVGALEEGLEPLSEADALVRAEDLPASPWTSADLFASLPHPWLGDLLLPRLPWRMDGRFRPIERTGPVLGDANGRMLRDVLCLSHEEVTHLADHDVLV